MKLFTSLFEQRIRGIRLIELIGLVLALAMVLWVCLSKAREGEDVRRINEIKAQIAAEQEVVTKLKIKVAELERPSRLESLAREHLGMKPASSEHEARLDSLGDISRATSRPVTEGGPSADVTPPAAPNAVPVVDEDAALISVARTGEP